MHLKQTLSSELRLGLGLMECESLPLQMRNPPPIFRGLWSPLCPVSTTYLIFPNTFSRPLLLSSRFRSSSSAALKNVEQNHPCTDSVVYEVPNPIFQPYDGFKEIPRRRYSPHWPIPKPTSNIIQSNNAKGGIERDSDNLCLGGLDRKKRLKRYSELLRGCALNRSLNKGKAIHGQVIRGGISPDSHLWVSLINFYVKCGSLTFARRLFDEMPEREVVSWTALIVGFVAEGYGSDAVNLLYEMRKEGVRPNEFTWASVLKACSMCLDLEFGKQVHAEVIKVGLLSDTYIGSALVDLYAKSGELEYADNVFFCMPEQNVVAWNALLNGYAQMGNGEEVLRLFCSMTELEMKLGKFTLSTVLKGCGKSRNLRAGQAVHSMAIKIGCELDEFISCSLVDMYSKCALSVYALKVFARIKNPDIVVWSAMISCLDQQGRKQEAAKLFCLMVETGLRPNQFTLTSIVNAATDLGGQHYCGSIHACVYKYGFESDNLVSNALISMYMNTGSMHDGYRVFNAMSHWDVVSWNALLSGFHDNETCDQGPRIFHQMLVEGFKPNMYTFISILRSCSSLLDVTFGEQVHAHIIKDSLQDDSYIGTALIDMYTKCRCLEVAEVIFNRLKERDLFTWTVIIGSYAQTGQGEKAVHCFGQMQNEGLKPNEFTLASCLRGCSRIASLENGRQLHSLAIKSGHCVDMFVSSALVDMYGKCGCIDDAETLFKSIDLHDTVLWNTIICGYSQHGQGEKAVEAFKIMLDEDALPDGVTFISLLSACSHMGLISEGKKYFHSMSEIYGITPSVEHYACMVDVLGRAGKLDEVENFIEQMKLTPNALIWETVLAACKIHGNVEFGERAAKMLFEIGSETDSGYISLSNIYASKGRWHDVSKIRALMTNRNVKKEPGCSWVEVDAQIHVFLSQDSSHPRILEINQKLEDLGQKLLSVGYIPNMDYVLHNLSDKEKRNNLFHHSERLALAFALIRSIPGKTVRIFKNLRICGDCHEFMKLISAIMNQQIVVRDINRFHHFQNGTCSCQDYW